MPSAPDVVITPAPKRAGKPCLTIAGRMIEPMATTVAGDDPETAANKALAITPASPRPPCQWPTIAVAKLIIRRATPPCVRKFPARMKNGIAMISNFSMPVNNFNATDWIGTSVIVNRYVSTVRPSEIEIGIPVNISPNSSPKMVHGLAIGTPASLKATGVRTSATGMIAGHAVRRGAGAEIVAFTDALPSGPGEARQASRALPRLRRAQRHGEAARRCERTTSPLGECGNTL